MALDTVWSVQVVLQYTSLLPRDVAVNNFHFLVDGGGVDNTIGLSIEAQLTNFYNDDPGTNSIGWYISSAVSRGTDQTLVYCYELDDPKPRAPRYSGSFTLDSSASTSRMPYEVAICQSYRGDYPSGVPQARRRGRNFIGPLGQIASHTDGTPDQTCIDDIAASAEQLAGAGSGVAKWIGYSPTDEESWEITAGWVDKEFDTQRRRQIAAASRVSWTAP